MRVRPNEYVCWLTAIALLLVATAARADELLVIPYTCSARSGEVVLRPSSDQGHRIVSRREDRDFTACSPADPAMCRKWTVHRFDIDCGGERVPWIDVVAAADRGRSAWVEDGSLQIRMPSWWTAGRRVGPDADIVRMPYGFAPKFGIDAIFVADEGPGVAGPGAPQVGGYASRMEPGAVQGRTELPSEGYDAAPGSALPPVSAAESGSGSRSSASSPRNIPFKIAPPAEGLTVEDVANTSEPPEERFAGSTEPAPASAAWSEPPPLPERPDPSTRRKMARPSADDGSATAETQTAQAPVVEPLDASGTPAAPSIINRSEASGEPAAAIDTSEATSKSESLNHAERAAAGDRASDHQSPAQQPQTDSVATDANATQESSDLTAPAPVLVTRGEATPSAGGTDLENQTGAAAPEPEPAQTLLARLLSGEPAAVAVTVITVGLMALLILGLSLRRRQNAEFSEMAERDLSSVSFEPASNWARPGPGTMMHNLSTPNLDSSAASSPPAMRALAPTLAVESTPLRPRQPDLAARRDPGLSWGDEIPRTHSEALRVLGMGVTRDASPASIKKVVDGLRMSWHPDHAEDEADRGVRELRTKQINAAWEIISGSRQQETEVDRAVEKLHQL